MRDDGLKDVTVLGCPAMEFEVTYHKNDSGDPSSRHRRLEREVLDSRGEDLYFRVEYPVTPAYRARAREVLATLQARIVLRPR